MDLILGDGKPAAGSSEWGTTKPGQEIADKLYDNTPASGRGFYPIETHISPTLESNLTQLADQAGLSLDARTAEQKDYPALMRSTGLHVNGELAKALHTAWTHERIAATREADETREAAQTAAEIAVREELRGEFGDQYEGLLLRAQKLAASNPKLKAILATGRVGSRPEIVRGLIEHVKAVNYR